MRKILIALVALILFSSHDMYLKLDTFFLPPNTSAKIELYNGTFDKSENVIARNRMIDVSLVGNGVRTAVDTTQWSEQENTTVLNFTTGAPGTWVAGVSTRARNIEMEAEAFNNYLVHDGVVDMLEWRKENNAIDQDAVEKYSKHVKTIFQVGEKRTDDWQTALGYPIEFIPLSNPYDLHAGDMLKMKLLREGEPLSNQLIYVDSDQTAHSHGDDHGHAHGDGEAHTHGEDGEHAHGEDGEGEGHSHTSAAQYRTDARGEFSFKVAADGIWHVRTIHLVESEEPGNTHESNWATLTFQVDHGQAHSHAEADHSHAEGHEAGIPAYVYWGGSLVVLAGLFFWFNRKD